MLATMQLHQTSSWDLNQIAPANWPAASFMTPAEAQAAGFFAFNNYSSDTDLVDSPGRCQLQLPAGVVQDAVQKITVDRGLHLVALDF